MSDIDIHVFKSESGGEGHGSKWIYKGTLAPGTHGEYERDVRDGDLNKAAEVLGKLSGSGKYMIFDVADEGVASKPRKRTIDVVERKAFAARLDEV